MTSCFETNTQLSECQADGLSTRFGVGKGTISIGVTASAGAGMIHCLLTSAGGFATNCELAEKMISTNLSSVYFKTQF